ncbi:MAG: hypothetical protein HW412_1496 [Bacteroidetes bacterium]|nr:hypothetical protein [Bacteroidota bacterium]
MKQSLSSRLDRYLPRYQWQTQHSLESSASRELCYNALVNARPQGLLVSLLLNLRGLRSHGTLKESLLRNGFTFLEESPPEAFIVGLVCKPWVWSGEIGCHNGPVEWLSDNREGFAKIVTVLGTEGVGGKTLLYTETRVFVEDGEARSRFALYWALIKPFSGLIRRAWLRGARRTAERLQKGEPDAP